MKKPFFYFVILVVFDCLVFFDFSPFLLLVALYGVLVLSKNLKKTLLWLLFLNLFIALWVGVLWVFGDRGEAIVVLMRANCIIALSLGLFFGRDFLFIAQSLQSFLPKKMNFLILMSSKMMSELRVEIEKAKYTLKVRTCGRGGFAFLCHSYGYLIGKIICLGLQKAQKIGAMLEVRGYNGHFYALREERVEVKDWGLVLAMIVSVVC
ncbi:hypothetical protein [Helicobacter brantae]|nr:hypothetical protein [Helicobacter brantae]